MFSQREDVTLANPLGPVARGRAAVEERLERAASNYRDGELTGFEQIAKYETPELAYLVEVERVRAKVGGREELAPVALRVTSIFRPEGDTWKVVHRHADPITRAAGGIGAPRVAPFSAKANAHRPPFALDAELYFQRAGVPAPDE